MPLAPRTRLGPYEITAPLGAGGMGEVYRARDTRLNRDVAIKVLPGTVATDPLALARFEREAQAVAALSHPNILAIFDFAHEKGAAYAVTELLEGQSLRERLNEGGLPVRKAVEIAVGLARGLAAAHERGLVHRDLKPENVFLTADGVVKILDFGLAKSVAAGVNAGANTETRAELTGEGTVLGTAGYMAPEQIRGQAIDARADLFALGSVLYEMLTGDRAFRRNTAADTMSAILREDPPEFPPERSIAPALDHIVRHCLEKTPSDRFQTARDVAFALETLSGASSSGARAADAALAAAGTDTPAVVVRRERRLWVAAILTLVGVATWLAFTRHGADPAPATVVRASILLPEGMRFRTSQSPPRRFAVSPDGGRIAYVVGPTGPGPMRLFIHSLEEGTSNEVPSSAGAAAPFWSPDGATLAFRQEGRLMVVDTNGVPTLRAAPAGGFWTAGPWGPGGRTLFVRADRRGFMLLPPAGGELRDLVAPSDPGVVTTPAWLPDGERFVFPLRETENANPQVWRGHISGAPWEPVAGFVPGRDSINFTYLDGWLIGGRDERVVARRVDEHGDFLGDEVVPLTGPVVTAQNGFGFSAASSVLVYQPVSGLETTELMWYDRSGARLSRLLDAGVYSNLELSPGGDQLLLAARNPTSRMSDVWAVDIRRGSRVRVTTDPDVDERSAVWTPDGGGIVYRGANGDLFTRPIGAGAALPFVTDGASKDPLPFSPDGGLILFRRSGLGTGNDIWIKPMRPEAPPRAFLATPASEIDAVLSPNGRWLAYASDESGRFEVYVTAFPSGAGKWAISTTGGRLPQWRRDGLELFYLSAENELMAVTTRPSAPAFDWDTPASLFVTQASEAPGSQYAVSPDGRRFLINSTGIVAGRESLTVVVGWKALLPRP